MSIYSYENNGIHAKILFCTLFDSLAKCAYPETKNNSERFKKTIANHTQWEDAERVSLLHLQRAFEITNRVPEEFSDLKDEINILFSKHFQPSSDGISNQLTLNIDPFYLDIKNKIPINCKGNPSQLGEVALEQLQHKNLLWLYRNSLVHEYRILGGGMEPTISFRSSNPSYHGKSTLTGDNIEDLKIVHKNFELHYPIYFFKKMCQESLNSVAKEYRDKGKSPYKVYAEGEYWIPKFNE